MPIFKYGIINDGIYYIFWICLFPICKSINLTDKQSGSSINIHNLQFVDQKKKLHDHNPKEF
ncbi:hypothetical protein COT27_02645 [Candidatus Kuenenbacteria bacterium CG08_land_8_20_14_0_20_37_23]|uniref:Uncharacterized protein n=1 Tax=Candidatus Kuenenbacteria bacterium CG08_land_8_20_14_0_20_37_23 TaxID=1974617 RepID=A0A2M6XSF6_9BACT|nr:MAG: hypothetical protein COT27_02645 [Candidatus Kuenenbacteria bacterium CG08_land_8_20_14_0_20_37_23]